MPDAAEGTGPPDGGDHPEDPAAAEAAPQEEGPRSSDADRDRFPARVHEEYAKGRLTEEELERRLDQVYRARTLVELYRVAADLPHPGPTPVVGWRPGHRPWWRRRS